MFPKALFDVATQHDIHSRREIEASPTFHVCYPSHILHHCHPMLKYRILPNWNVTRRASRDIYIATIQGSSVFMNRIPEGVHSFARAVGQSFQHGYVIILINYISRHSSFWPPQYFMWDWSFHLASCQVIWRLRSDRSRCSRPPCTKNIPSLNITATKLPLQLST